MKNIILFLLIYLTNVATAQLPRKPYEALKLEGVTVKGYYTLFDESTIDGGSDGYNRLTLWFNPYVIDGNRLYTFGFLSLNDFVGGMITCVDMTNGNLIWKNKFDLTTQDRQEAPQSIYINQQGNIELIGQRSVDTFSLNRYPPFRIVDLNTRFFRKIFDKYSGQQIYNHNASNLDHALPMTYSSAVNAAAYSFILPNEDGTFSFLFKPRNQFTYNTIYSRVDSLGRDLYLSDTINFHSPVTSFVKTEDGNFLVLTKDSLYRAHIQLRNNNFEPIDSYYLQPNVHTGRMYELATDKVKKRFLFFNLTFNSENPDSLCEYRFYESDFSGNILRHWIFYYPSERTFSTFYGQDDSFYLIYTQRDPQLDGYLHIAKGNEQGNFENVYSFRFENYEKIIYPTNSFINQNGDLVLMLDESAYYIKEDGNITQDNRAAALSIVILPKEQLPLLYPQSTTNSIIKSIAFEIYPNPASNECFVKAGDKKITALKIIDVAGRIVLSQKEDVSKIDVSCLVPGYYMVQCEIDGHWVCAPIMKY